ncbi:hypothetical protein LAZ67_12002863 [Cordylochernes scorpioides]|uniref:protein-serine/threonine phosphatase n=1 Tax=Cordylochernes scorpioides TaxID=51811 RepID=A0ABY6L2W6_9ARAC|nr:hypothetical protein LAZ67_12002863 [Cordylochernes scorpioides]
MQMMEGLLNNPNTRKKTHWMCAEKFAAGVCSMQGWRVAQEDAHTCISSIDQQGTSLFAVYDGHGGGEVARYCSQHLPGVLQAHPAFHSDPESALSSSLLQLDQSLKESPAQEELWNLVSDEDSEDSDEDILFIEDVEASVSNHETSLAIMEGDLIEMLSEELDENYDDGLEEGEDEVEEIKDPGFTSGTTALVCLFRDNFLYVANVGDSRGILVRKNTWIPLTKDHKPYDEKELCRIEQAGGWVSRDGRVLGDLNLSRTLGDHRYKTNSALAPEDQVISAKPDIQVTSVTKGDILILACDGIWEVLKEQEVVDFVRRRLRMKVPLHKICEQLLNRCLATEQDALIGVDNMTCLMVKFK